MNPPEEEGKVYEPSEVILPDELERMLARRMNYAEQLMTSPET